jgi:hypothetical protein
MMEKIIVKHLHNYVLMYIRNRKGPNTDPWGTPASIPSHPDENPSKTTFCFLSSHLHNYVLEHHIITEHQSGFQPKDSTVNQLVFIYNTIISNLDIGKDIRFIGNKALRNTA